MPEIRILPRELQNRIAAGEVIERPASVVKELIENALDAGATDISVEILDGGSRMIRVSDNGRGMEREDALICFHPHATSKIEREEDLFEIRTLGFRGEALSSIASVSRLRIVTAPAGSTLGVSVEIEGGEVKRVRESAHVGTTLEVRDLFFNTPARRKFLRSRRTEVYHIVEAVTAAALSQPAVAFSLTVDREETLLLPKGEGVRERVLQVYGEEFLQGLLDVEEDGLRALVSREGVFRSSRANQYIFVNHRPVKDAALRHAVYSAYDTLLPRERHPVFFLYLSVPPSEVDFNVHPAKSEVRFSDKEAVYRLVLGALRSALTGAGSPQSTEARDGEGEGSTCDVAPRAPAPPPSTTGIPFASEPIDGYVSGFESIYLGDVFVAYTDGRGLTILDHHAAHERILYEKLRSGVGLDVTQMLFPQQVRLPAREYGAIVGRIGDIRSMGIDVEDFGHNTLVVRAVPAFLSGADLPAILSDLAFCLVDHAAGSPVDDLRERLAKRIACHASVRGPVKLRHDEVVRLLEDLSGLEDPEHCPHGRPTRIRMSLDDLRRMFKRTG